MYIKEFLKTVLIYKCIFPGVDGWVRVLGRDRHRFPHGRELASAFAALAS